MITADMEVNCTACGKAVPEGNIKLHSLHCLKVKAPVVKESSGVKGDDAKMSVAQKKKRQSTKPNIENDDLDSMLAEMTLVDSSCGFQGCRKKVNLLGLQCYFCRRRFCMEHNIPEIHGCAEDAKKYARQAIKQKPTSSSNDTKRAQLKKKLGSKLEEFSAGRQSKTKGKSKK